MKILQVITSLHIGGAEKLIADITPLLIKRGIKVDVLAFDGTDTAFKHKLINSGVSVFSFGKGINVYNPIFIFRLVKLMNDYDIIHTHNTSPQFFAAIANIFTRRKMVTTEHSTSNHRRGNRFLRLLDRWMYNKYIYTICISEMTRINLLKHLGYTRSLVRVIHNGIDVDTYNLSLPLSNSEKHTQKFVITMVSGFRYQKDHETAIRMLTHLDRDRFELWLVGDGERRETVEAYIDKLGLGSCVRLWGIRSDIPSILKSSDVVLQSSHIEGFGLAAVEGMASGKPVLATDINGLSQIVEGAGILFPPKDDKFLAKEVFKLATDQTYYNIIAKRCLLRAHNYDLEKMLDGYENIYNKMM